MIHYFVPYRYREHSAFDFLASWGEGLRGRLCPLTYHELIRRRRLPPGVALFTHFEGLSDPELRMVRALFLRMQGSPGFHCLNDPHKALDRYAFMHRLCEAGINNFRAYRLDESFEGMKFPVFLRLANEHAFTDARLYHSEAELRIHLNEYRRQAPFVRPEDLLVVEYCDVAENGLYKKYSAIRIGDEIIPRHILFNDQWISKHPVLCDEDKAAEEASFIRNFSQHDQLRAIFDLAGIDYGRIDYSLQHGEIRVWEINTNPVIVPARSKIDPTRLASQTESATRIIEAFEKLDRLLPEGPPIPIWSFTDLLLRRAVRKGRKAHRKRSESLLNFGRGIGVPRDPDA